MKVVGRVWIRRTGIFTVFYYIRVREGEWLRTNNTTLQAKPNQLHKKFNLSRNFKQWTTSIVQKTQKLPPLSISTSNWQKEWDVEGKLVRRMFRKRLICGPF